MTTLTNWLSPSTMHSLGWTLLHFLWQGTAVGAMAAVLMTACRRAPARYVLAVGALGLMLAMPAAPFLLLASTGHASSAFAVPDTLPVAVHGTTSAASGFARFSPS